MRVFSENCPDPKYFKNEICDDINNTPMCGFDGEDCCIENNIANQSCDVCMCYKRKY